MIKIFRIEDDKKIGPYANDNVYDEVLDHHDDEYNIAPNPVKDFDDNILDTFVFFDGNERSKKTSFRYEVKERIIIDRMVDKDYRCAFVSLSSMKRWFTTEELLALEERGYVCNVYEFDYYNLNDMHVLSKQIIIDPKILKDNYKTYKISKIMELESEF